MKLPQQNKPKRGLNSYGDKDTFIALLMVSGNEKNLRKIQDITKEDINRVRKLLQAATKKGL